MITFASEQQSVLAGIFLLWLDKNAIPIYHTKNYSDYILAAYYIDHKFVIEYDE